MAEGKSTANPRPRISLVHALFESMAPIDAAFAESWPEAETLHLYDQSLYADFNPALGLTPEIYQRVEGLLRHSASTGARAILFTGSLFGAPVEAAREGLQIPVLTAYEAMIEAAFAGTEFPRLGLMATVTSTVDMITADIKRYAERRGVNYHLDARFVSGAIDALLAGDRSQHDAMLVDAATAMTDCDVLMLGQFSMAPVAGKIAPLPGRKILSAPSCAVAKLKSLVVVDRSINRPN